MKKMDRLNVKAFLGNRPSINLGEALKITFSTEIKGSGDTTPDTPPEIGVLFVGCGMLETIDKASGAVSMTFAASGKTCTAAGADFVAAGFAIGDIVTTDAVLNPGPFTVTNVAATVLTFSETVEDEGPVTKTATALKVLYTPQDLLDGPSITIYFYQHDILHVMTGCRGTWSIDGTAGEYGKIKWEFTGLYAGPTDATAPTDSTFNATLPPPLKSGAFLLGAYAGTIGTFKMVYGNEIAKRPDANAATGFLAQFIKDRKVTAEIDPEAPALSTFDPVTLLTAGTEQTMGITFGTSAGNRMKLHCPKVVLDSAKYADREGILTYSLPLLVCPSAGADDVTLTFN
ncbi:MAG TPA: hypothetical protein DD658_09715 [Deltaproteobacteria bacterium]|nr:hypothetical protein [Deltaproteobacteria bacterium]